MPEVLDDRTRLQAYINERLGWYGVCQEWIPGLVDDIMGEVNNFINRQESKCPKS